MFSEGHWKVWVTTDEMLNAATQALVSMTVYGHKGNSGPIPLGLGDESNFSSGSTDQFDVSMVFHRQLNCSK